MTSVLPKPLIPLINRPLITHAFDLLLAAGIREFVVNTHHLAARYEDYFPHSRYREAPIRLVKEEPEILETGGGLANAAEYLKDGDFIVFNGDIYTSLPLDRAMAVQRAAGNVVTLVLRAEGPNRNVTFDANSGRVLDLRQALETEPATPFQFTGIYLARPEFLDALRPVKESVVPTWLRLIKEGARIGGVAVDEGQWWDLGDREAYLAASAALADDPKHAGERLADSARIDGRARIDNLSVIGPKCVIGEGAVIEQSILWSHVEVAPGATLRNSIVTTGQRVEGEHIGKDL